VPSSALASCTPTSPSTVPTPNASPTALTSTTSH
jgi:hypothetical protein